MTNTTKNTPALILADQVGDLLIAPTREASVAAQVSTVVSTESHAFRIPVVVSDPVADWVAEGEEIAPSDEQVSEVVSEMHKLAGLTIITNELRSDSSPEAQEAIGQGLARDIARKLDAAFFGNLANPAAPKGLAAQAVTAIDGGKLDGLEPFIRAIHAAESRNATLTSFVANPADLLTLALIKKADGSNEALMQPDPTLPARRMVMGVPVFSSTAVAAGTIWGIPQDRAYLVIRQDAEVEIDGSVFFTSDRTAVRAIMRAGFAFPQPEAFVRISTSDALHAALDAAGKKAA